MRFFAILPFLGLALANPLTKRQSSTTCGSNAYSSTKVSAALKAGCNYLQKGKTVGSDKYPHKYSDYEKFTFPVDGPWYEFPIKESGTYSGGSPGADRVIFNAQCEYAGSITHTGASGNDFVGCSGTS
jgi:hypothetical protein